VQVRLHGKKQQQQGMMVERRRMQGAVVVEHGMVQLQGEDGIVALVLPPVEGEEQRLVGAWGDGKCQKANDIEIGYALGFQEHAHGVPGPLRQPAPPVQQLMGWNDP
jgi:hypothetical protein